MRFVIFSLLIIFTVACDAPERTRFQTSGNYDAISTEGATTQGGTGQEQEEDNGITETQNPIQQIPGFESCSLGLEHYGGNHIGFFGICQSSQNESTFKVVMGQSDFQIGTCFVPVHIIGGNSFKLGIAECVHNEKDKVYDMVLTKERPEPINGVMVIKAGSAVNGYMQCMNAKLDYMQNLPGTNFNQQCLQQAGGNPDIYANCVCTLFKGAFSTYYKQVELR